ncbi:MAG: LytTR family DNA-binding domain-containing protein [Rhizomicrobium sp.]
MRRIGDIWQRLGTNGARSGTSGSGWRTFLYAAAPIGVLVALINTLNIITTLHNAPRYGLLAPVVWEGSSWISLMAFLWIPWTAFRLAPLTERPYWRAALVHPAGAVLFALAHVLGFIALRKLAYAAAGQSYVFGAFGPNFLYEFSKDGLGYILMIGGFTLIARLLQTPRTANDTTFTIRDGARIVRIPIDDILAASSAGNYVEFALRDGRKPLMRSPLSAIESELAPHGFVRVHRSWLVNPARMTGLTPNGSGDYTVELGALSVPLSRRFPGALARLRAA